MPAIRAQTTHTTHNTPQNKYQKKSQGLDKEIKPLQLALEYLHDLPCWTVRLNVRFVRRAIDFAMLDVVLAVIYIEKKSNGLDADILAS